MRTILENNNGISTIIAMMMMVMLTMIGVAAVKMANDEVTIAGNERNEMMAFYSAEAGLEKAAAAIQASYIATNMAPATLPSGSETINGCVAAYSATSNGAATQDVLTLGTLAGLNALIQSFTITATGSSGIDNSQVVLSQEFQCALVPIFQFAVFYGNDLEIAPGPDMTLLGRVHSNGNLWLQAGANLYMDSYVTASGNILHGRKGPGGVSNGNVYIKDTDGNYQNMLNGGDWLDADDGYWYDSASSRWGGRVQDSAFGQGELNLPLTNAGDPHKIIERGGGNADSYEHMASVRVIDGQVEAKVAGTWVNVTGLLPAGAISTKTFYDGREGTNVNATEVDMSVLKTSSYYPSNGVIYASDQRSGFNGLRLVNGDDLGTGLTIVSENPVYVQGDYNTVNKKPAAIMGDAVTFLSNSWHDSASAMSKYDRPASATTVNASIMTGNTNTTSSNYNGGLENLPRFLEVWSGINFNYTGSLVNLWNSQQANGDWGGSYYSPPNRNWKYDVDLDDPNKLPPETPMVRTFQRTGWKQDNVGYALD